MKKLETISQSLFDAKAAEAVAKNPIRKEVALKNVEILRDNQMLVDGVKIGMNRDAFKAICKIVGLPVGFDKTFSSAFGDKARQALVNRLKTAKQANGSTHVSLVVNPDTRQIISVQKDPRDLISNSSFIKTTTEIIDRYNLDVKDFSIGENGAIVINTISSENAWGFEGLNDEDHFGGATFINSPDGGFRVTSFLHRLVCSNGMIGTGFDETLTLNPSDPMNFEKFYDSLNKLAKVGFRPKGYEKQIRLAMNTRASLNELESAHTAIRLLSDGVHRELEAWVPYHSTMEAFYKAGIDAVFLNTTQKKTSRTGTTVWDLVNGITHFATHDNGFTISDYDRRRLQVEASRILTKDFDMLNIVKSPF